MVDVICVDPKYVQTVWPEVKHFIRAAYDTGIGDDTFEDIERKVLDGDFLVWVAFDDQIKAVCITNLIISGRKKLCILTAAAGQDCCWAECIKPIENYARNEGCDAVRLYGRRGWKRIFKDYCEPWVALEKKLENAR